MTRNTKPTPGRRPKPKNLKLAEVQLPPDPEQENHVRAAMANVAIVAFRQACGTDREDAVGDLLAGLMHLCDRDPGLGDFEGRLEVARWFYREETATDAEYGRI